MTRLAVAIVALVLLPDAAIAGPAPTKTSATGTIKVLRLHRITVHGRRDVTCRIAASSPRTGGFVVGMRASIRCAGGVLVLLLKVRTAKQVTTTPRPPKLAPATTPLGVYVVLGGPITALTATSITVDGKVTCRIGRRSPSVSDFHVGSAVTGRCDGGVLTALTRSGDS